MIKEVYEKYLANNKKIPSDFTREEFLAFAIIHYWDRYIDPQSMCYYIGCTEDDVPEDSRVKVICSSANRWSKKCGCTYTYLADTDSQMIRDLSGEFLSFYLSKK